MRRPAPILAAFLAMAAPQPAARAAGELPALAPTALPMAIRDGRVASITVHAIPFVDGAQVLDPDTAAALQRLAAEAAGACFLTGQAVGHARPGTPGPLRFGGAER